MAQLRSHSRGIARTRTCARKRHAFVRSRHTHNAGVHTRSLTAASARSGGNESSCSSDVSWIVQQRWKRNGSVATAALAAVFAAADAAGMLGSAHARSAAPADTQQGTSAALSGNDASSNSMRERLSKLVPGMKARSEKVPMAYTTLWELTENGKVESVQMKANRREVDVTLSNDPYGTVYSVVLPYDPQLMRHLARKAVPVDVEPQTFARKALDGVVNIATPLVAVWILSRIFTESLETPGGDDLSQPLARKVPERDLNVSLNDVAGIGQIRQEVEEVIHYLQNAELYEAFGAKLPAGVLLVGPPGTGKTLLARAIASEARVTFLSASGSEFSEMFVGVGASRVRQTFMLARKSKPCILFIDEFDAVAEERSGSSGADLFGSDESANTINQLLTEMDGFEDNSGVIVLAATNRPQVLDKALTRPGRFDRMLSLPLPDAKGREEILQVHARGKRVDPEINWQRVARSCAGMTGADIENLMNEAAIEVSRYGGDVVTEDAIIDCVEKVRRDSRLYTAETAMTDVEESIEEIEPTLQRSVAAYCAGKALCAYAMPEHDEVQKVTLFPDGRPNGFVTFLPLESTLDSSVVDPTYLKARLTVLLAGRAAERELVGPEHVSALGTSDLEDANFLARQMVMRYGINRRLGPISLVTETSESFLQSDRELERSRMQPMSDATQAAVLQETRELLEIAEERAIDFVRENRRLVRECQSELLASRSLLGKNIKVSEDDLQPPWEWPREYGVVYEEGVGHESNGDGTNERSPVNEAAATATTSATEAITSSQTSGEAASGGGRGGVDADAQ